MLTANFERIHIVLEIFSKTIHSIVTIEAGWTKGERMSGYESQIHLTMTAIAGIQSKCCDVTPMAIITGEQLTRRRKLVTF